MVSRTEDVAIYRDRDPAPDAFSPSLPSIPRNMAMPTCYELVAFERCTFPCCSRIPILVSAL
jgi:hypothetical protein